MPKLGYKQTEEHKEKSRKAPLGTVWSVESRNKLSNALKGNQNGKGQKMSEENKKKLLLANLGKKRSEETRRKLSEAHKGIIYSPESILKRSLAITGEKNSRWKGGEAKYMARKRERLAGRPKAEICEVCGSGSKIVYDHDHATGKFRGWICQHCNATLGFARDNVEVLYKLINYLNQSRGLVVLNQELLTVQQPNITT